MPLIRRTGRRSSLRMGVEALEGRRLLSGKGSSQITIQELPAPNSAGQYELLITGTKGNDSILVSDNGTGTAGNMFVSTGGGLDYMSLHAISLVVIETGRGNDDVTYELDGNLAPNVSEEVLASSSGVSLAGQPALRGGGALHFTTDIVGKISDQSSLVVGASADPKAATTATFNVTGEVDGQLETGLIPVKGYESKKAGNMTFDLNSSSTVGTDGALSAFVYGGAKQNRFSTGYFGTNDGDVTVDEIGYGASDKITASIDMSATSTGTVGNHMEAGVGSTGRNANLEFTIYRGTDSTSGSGLFAAIYSKSKKSIAEQTGNVINETSGSDQIVT